MSFGSRETGNAKAGVTTLKTNWPRLRFIPLAIAALAMATGFSAGLSRLGFPISAGVSSAAELHGVLMISGFLGTLISLERAVALGSRWGYLAPALSAIGTLTLFIDPRLGALAFAMAGGVLFLASVQLALRQFALFSAVLVVAAGCWPLGTALWAIGYELPVIVQWWLNFLILTIAAERLELSRILRVSPLSQVMFAIAAALLLIGSARGELTAQQAPFTAVGLMSCALWLLRHDIARLTVRQAGQPRFSAVSILIGHIWLGLAGILLLIAPLANIGLVYDAVVHTITIGVVLSMIFGHAPIIFPAITGIRVTISGIAYIPLAVLHSSVILRVASDVLEEPNARLFSAILTIIALIGYVSSLIMTSLHTRLARHRDKEIEPI